MPAAIARAPDAAVRLAASPALTPTSARIVAHVDAHNAEALALLERAVNINSGTQNFAGVREVGKLFAPSSRRWGSPRAGSTARRSNARGTSSPSIARPGQRILLIGHLDTVFEADSPFQKFERLDASQRARAGHHRHEGRRRHHRPGAQGAAGGRRARPHERHGRHDRRRGGVRRPAGRRARGARRRGQRRGRRHRLRGRRRRSADAR